MEIITNCTVLPNFFWENGEDYCNQVVTWLQKNCFVEAQLKLNWAPTNFGKYAHLWAENQKIIEDAANRGIVIITGSKMAARFMHRGYSPVHIGCATYALHFRQPVLHGLGDIEEVVVHH